MYKIINVVFIGAGHTNTQVIVNFGPRNNNNNKNQRRRIYINMTLINDNCCSFYSGMLPGAIAGQYNINDLAVSCQKLMNWVDGQFIHAAAQSINWDTKHIICRQSSNAKIIQVPFDIVCIDVGSTSRGLDTVPGAESYVIPTRPISQLYFKIRQFEKNWNIKTTQTETESNDNDPEKENNNIRYPKICVVGAGAAGIELVSCVQERLISSVGGVDKAVLINKNSTLEDALGSNLGNKTMRELNNKNIQILNSVSAQKVEQNRVILDNNDSIDFDLCLWSCGASPQPFLSNAGVDLDDNGYMLVDSTLSSINRRGEVLGAGDCITIESHPNIAKAGVYAVREGSIMTKNLEYLIDSILASFHNNNNNNNNNNEIDVMEMINYEPQTQFLRIINLGNGRSIGSWKGISYSGRTCWFLKNWIDTRWMNKFSMAIPEEEELTMDE